jgi:hypothetical protein
VGRLTLVRALTSRDHGNATGEVERRSEVDILARLIGGLDGVVGVRSHLSFRYDDSGKVPRIERRI